MLKIVKQIAIKTEGSSFFDKLVIKDILRCFQKQRPEYSNFEYLGHGGFSLVLKTSIGEDKRALKVVKCSKHIEKEVVKKEYEYLKLVSRSSYFSAVYDCFYLFEEDDDDKEGEEAEEGEEEVMGEQDQNSKLKYLIIDMELCECNLSTKLDEMRKANVKLNDKQKGILAVQMLDSLNMLHMKEILHRDVKPQNILVSVNNNSNKQMQDIPFTVKLSDLGLATQLKSEQSKSFLSGKHGTNNYMSIETSEGGQRKQSDLFSMGLVLLEMDNYLTFKYSTISNLELCLLQREGISALNKQKLNKQSPLFKIIEIFLNPNYKQRTSANEMLEYLISQQEYEKVDVYSLITEAALFANKPLQIPQPPNKNHEYSQILQSQLSNEAQKGKEGVNSIEQMHMAILQSQNYLSKSTHLNINEIGSKSFLSPDEIKCALKELHRQKKFASFSLLGRGSAGIVFSVRNVAFKRNTVIKLCSGNDRVGILREVSVMQKCQSPYIIKFFGYEFFSDERKNQYAWMEFERCTCSLSHFLDLHREDLSNELKLQLGYQIIDSVNTLHSQGVLHGDIKLDNFLISEDVNGNHIIKLSDFDQSVILSRKITGFNLSTPLFLRGKGGTIAFNSPEKNLSKDNPSTFYSDSYSVGLCLLLLDNYTAFEKKFFSSCFYLLQPYKIPFSNCLNLLNQTSQLYQLSQLILQYVPEQRKQLAKIVSENENNSIILFSKVHSNLLQINQANSLIIGGVDCMKIVKYLNSNDTILQKQLSSLTLNLSDNRIQSERMEQLSNGLSQLIQLSSLTLDLKFNNIQSEEMQQLSNGLSKLIQLSSLTLDLSDNNIQNEGMQQLSKGLSKLIQLSSLTLDLQRNKIQNEGMQQLSYGLSKLIQLSSLTLDLKLNNIQNEGMEQLSNGFSKLIQLSSLTLNIQRNKIQHEGMKQLSFCISKLIFLSSLTLDLKLNNIQSEGIEQLSNGFSKLIQLSSLALDLSGNNIENEGMQQLTNGFSKLIQLQSLTLDINYNKIQNEGMHQLPNRLSKLIQLSSLTLNLSWNNIESQGMQQLSIGLSKLIQLSSLTLNIQRNKIQNEGMKQLSFCISQLIFLSSLTLDLKLNNIQSEGIEQLSNGLSKLTQLSSLTLNLSWNNIESGGMQQLLNGLSKLIQLSSLTLHLQGNNINNEEKAKLENLMKQMNVCLVDIRV